MPENQRGNDTPPSNNPGDYDLPATVTVDKPDAADLPDDLSPSDIPDTETIEEYTDGRDDIDFGEYVETFQHDFDTDADVRAFAVLYNATSDMHPQELAARAGIDTEEVPDVIDRLQEQEIIRQTRVQENIPFYEFFGLSDEGLRLRRILD